MALAAMEFLRRFFLHLLPKPHLTHATFAKNFEQTIRADGGRAGVPEDIGPMIAALLSDENRWVNGQRIEVSRGMVL